MIRSDMPIFFRLSATSRLRILHPARAIEQRDGVWRAALEDDQAPVSREMEVLVYFEHEQEFHQQPARIEDIVRGVNGERILEFRTTGKPISAESRQSYRVSTATAGLTARVGREPECPLLDISATGFSIVASASYTVGRVVDVAFRHEDKEYTGLACVLSVWPLSPTRVRYGFRLIEEKRPGQGLAVGLQRLSAAAQRLQLRRLSGAA